MSGDAKTQNRENCNLTSAEEIRRWGGPPFGLSFRIEISSPGLFHAHPVPSALLHPAQCERFTSSSTLRRLHNNN